MAVNLETLLPHALSQTTPPLVPSNSEESLLGDFLSHASSMYGNEGLSLLADADLSDFDPALLKLDYSSGGDAQQFVDVNGDDPYQTAHSPAGE